MKIKPELEAKYTEARPHNMKDGYSSATLWYWERWAGLMEARKEAGEAITKKMVEDTSTEADTSGVSGAMYAFAGKMIAHYWVHGAEFEVSYNEQYMSREKAEALAKAKPGATVNPSILTVG